MKEYIRIEFNKFFKMGNSGCGGTRVKHSKVEVTQQKLQELMGSVTLQAFESKIKMFAIDGVLSVRQLDEILLSGLRPVRTKNNALLRDILTNPFFHATKDAEDEDENEGKEESAAEPEPPKEPPMDDGEKGDGLGEEKPEEEGGEADAAGSPEDGNEGKEATGAEDNKAE